MECWEALLLPPNNIENNAVGPFQACVVFVSICTHFNAESAGKLGMSLWVGGWVGGDSEGRREISRREGLGNKESE
jgi:hypothetical protein